MGYSLEFYSLEWNRLARLFLDSDEALAREIISAGPRIFIGNPGPTDWQGNLLAMTRKANPTHAMSPEPFSSKVRIVPPGQALAVTAAIRFLGTRVGGTIHTSRGGDSFRSAVRGLDEQGATERIVMSHLLERPLFGITHDDYPSWGGLSRQELQNPPPRSLTIQAQTHPDPDIQSWYSDLLLALEGAKRSKTDLVTLYL